MRIELPDPSQFSKLLKNASGELAKKDIYGICTDSREIQAGDLYVAIRGERFDGHEFLKMIFEKGAACALVVEKDMSLSGQQIKVNNPLKTMGEIALSWRKRFDIPVIAITGSNGKTTTKELLKHVLSEKFKVHATEGNYNTSVSLPLTLLTLNAEHTCSVLEMGASQKGDIALLCNIADPTHGLITNVAPAHLQGFGSLENVALAKGELFEALSSGLAFINHADERIKELPVFGKIISFGYSTDSDYSADIFQEKDGTLTLIIEAQEINTGSQNQTFVKNLLAVTAIARELGIAWDSIKSRVLSFIPPQGRCRIMTVGGLTVIDDTYNANLDSTYSAINLLQELRGSGKKIFVFGDMLELGKESRDQHHKVGLKCLQTGLSAVFTIGTESKATDSALNGSLYHQHFDDKISLYKALKEIVAEGDSLLVKGSRGMAMETIIQNLQGN